MPVHAHETSRAGAAETIRKVEGESRRHDGVSQKEAEGGDRADNQSDGVANSRAGCGGVGCTEAPSAASNDGSGERCGDGSTGAQGVAGVVGGASREPSM